MCAHRWRSFHAQQRKARNQSSNEDTSILQQKPREGGILSTGLPHLLQYSAAVATNRMHYQEGNQAQPAFEVQAVERPSMNETDFESCLKSIYSQPSSLAVTEARRMKLPLDMRSMGASPPVPCLFTTGGGGCRILKMEPFSSSLRRPRSASISDDSEFCNAAAFSPRKRQRIDSHICYLNFSHEQKAPAMQPSYMLEAVHEGQYGEDPKDHGLPNQHQVFKPLMQPATAALATSRASPLHHQSNSPVKDGAPSSTLPSQQPLQQIKSTAAAATPPFSLTMGGSDNYDPKHVSNVPHEANAMADPGFDCGDPDDLTATVNSWLIEEQESSLQEMLVGLFD